MDISNGVSFKGTAAELELAGKIAERAVKLRQERGVAPGAEESLDIEMDVLATHLNGCKLKLLELLNADDFNFSHDVFGIRTNLDRLTGKIGGGFHPRYAEKQ